MMNDQRTRRIDAKQQCTGVTVYIYYSITDVSAAVSSQRPAASHGDELHVASCVRIRGATEDAGPGRWRAANRMRKVRLVIRGFALVLRPWWSALSAFISDLSCLFTGVHTGE